MKITEEAIKEFIKDLSEGPMDKPVKQSQYSDVPQGEVTFGGVDKDGFGETAQLLKNASDRIQEKIRRGELQPPRLTQPGMTPAEREAKKVAQLQAQKKAAAASKRKATLAKKGQKP